MNDIPIQPRDMTGRRESQIGKFKKLIIGGGKGDVGMKITREGLWAGNSSASGAPARIELDGTNNLAGGSNFTDLIGTPSSYKANEILKGNGSADGLEFSGVTISSGTNTFTITKGTAIITAKAGTNSFDYLIIGTMSDAAAPINCLYNSSTTGKLSWKDSGGVSHSLY
jgi:hypothetical protein